MTHLERFLAVMEYQPVDRVPMWEVGVWPQTVERWKTEGLDPHSLHWNWFSGEEVLGMDPREFIPFASGMMPGFEPRVIEEDGQTRLFQDSQGRVRRTMTAGAVAGGSPCMDTYLRFPVENMADWQAMKKRYDLSRPRRYEANWRTLRPEGWRRRQHPLIFGPNCSTLGFYWIAREWMGTENLSLAWYDQPELMHDMMEFWGDFLIEAARPILETTTLEYICLNEDLSMKNGPLLGPETYRTFIWPHLKRVADFYLSHGVRYLCIDTDGDPQALIPLMMDAGVRIIWPLERAAGQDPAMLRKKFGRTLRLFGGVDKRALAAGRDAIDAHLESLRPVIEDGGFVPTVDHTVPPDVSWDNFRYYMDAKRKALG